MDTIASKRAAVTGGALPALRKRDKARARGLLDRQILIPAVGDAFRKLDPTASRTQPGDVRRRHRRHSRHRSLRPRRHRGRDRPWLLRPDHLLAVDHPAVRQLRGSGGGRPWQGAGGDPSQDAYRDPGETARESRRRTMAAGVGARTQARRHRAGRGRRSHSQRRRGHRRHRLRQRGGDHRRVRAGHPRERRRPFGRDRRHAGDIGPDQGAHHRGAGLDVPRPDDCAGRGRRRGRRRPTRSR